LELLDVSVKAKKPQQMSMYMTVVFLFYHSMMAMFWQRLHCWCWVAQQDHREAHYYPARPATEMIYWLSTQACIDTSTTSTHFDRDITKGTYHWQ
jgi:hypothetical protein